MNQTKQAPLPLKKEKNSFVLKLNKKLYRDDIVQLAVKEDKDWIKRSPASAQTADHFCLRLKTDKVKDVYDWMNYLIYLHKT